MAKKRLVLRRQMGITFPPDRSRYLHQMPKMQWVFHAYRVRINVLLFMRPDIYMSQRELDAGYCLDSQVDSAHPNLHDADIQHTMIPRGHLPNIDKHTNKDTGTVGNGLPRANLDGPAAAFVGGNRSTRPRDPSYVPGSFGGNRGRAERNRF